MNKPTVDKYNIYYGNQFCIFRVHVIYSSNHNAKNCSSVTEREPSNYELCFSSRRKCQKVSHTSFLSHGSILQSTQHLASVHPALQLLSVPESSKRSLWFFISFSMTH